MLQDKLRASPIVESYPPDDLVPPFEHDPRRLQALVREASEQIASSSEPKPDTPSSYVALMFGDNSTHNPEVETGLARFIACTQPDLLKQMGNLDHFSFSTSISNEIFEATLP